jgi:hypothetical protein
MQIGRFTNKQARAGGTQMMNNLNSNERQWLGIITLRFDYVVSNVQWVTLFSALKATYLDHNTWLAPSRTVRVAAYDRYVTITGKDEVHWLDAARFALELCQVGQLTFGSKCQVALGAGMKEVWRQATATTASAAHNGTAIHMVA